jgi:hypothetical protein
MERKEVSKGGALTGWRVYREGASESERAPRETNETTERKQTSEETHFLKSASGGTSEHTERK